MKTQLKIQMLGSSFSIQSDQSQEQIEAVLRYLNDKIDEVLERNAGAEPIKIALLAALNIADEAVRLRQAAEARSRPLQKTGDEIEIIADHLIRKIDDALVRDHPSSCADAKSE
jgi:cell division protein ZapA (FtsZ GTPase activity inhibitor)